MFNFGCTSVVNALLIKIIVRLKFKFKSNVVIFTLRKKKFLKMIKVYTVFKSETSLRVNMNYVCFARSLLIIMQRRENFDSEFLFCNQ